MIRKFSLAIVAMFVLCGLVEAGCPTINAAIPSYSFQSSFVPTFANFNYGHHPVSNAVFLNQIGHHHFAAGLQPGFAVVQDRGRPVIVVRPSGTIIIRR